MAASVGLRRLTHFAVLLAASGAAVVILILLAASCGVIQRSSCTSGERSAVVEFPQIDGRVHTPAWNYEEDRCWTEFPHRQQGAAVVAYYHRQLVAHGWSIVRSPKGGSVGSVIAKRAGVTYEARVGAKGVGIFVHEDTPLYPFFS